MKAVSGEVAPVNDREGRFVGTFESDPEYWLLDWLTAGQLPRFNRKGTLRVVQRAGLGAWLAGVEPGLLRAARDRALAQVPDAPWILIVKGPISLLHGPRPIAVVGTRRISVSGRLAVDGLMEGMKGNAHLIQEHVAEMLHMPTDPAAAMGWVALERQEQGEDDHILAGLHPYEPRGFDAVVASLEWDRNAVRTG